MPKAVKALTHTFAYNDLASLEQLLASHPGEFAAVILEPMNVQYPKPGFLEGVAELTRRHGAVLVFDETITGFRFDIGGAQALFGVTPDLATFGKGMANGFPLSAVVGRADIMAKMNDIFFSGTFGGETLSLAAAKACIEALRCRKGPERLAELGNRLIDGLQNLIASHGLGHLFNVSGHPSWSFLNITPSRYPVLELKSLLMQELIEQGFLSLGSHNLNLSHSEADIDALIACYANVLPLLAEVEAKGSMAKHFRGKFLEPVFKVR